MKKQLFALIFSLGTSVIFGAGHAYAQASGPAIRVEVPFAFIANNKTLPAGTYHIKSASDNRIVWRIQNTDVNQFLMARNLTGVKEYGNVRLTFHRYGEQNFLVGFKTASYEVDLPASNGEKSLRRNQKDLAKYDVVTVNAPMAAGSGN